MFRAFFKYYFSLSLCGRMWKTSVAAISTHLLPFCKWYSRPLLQACERAGTTEESTWGVPRKLRWSACFYEPSLIWGCHTACVSRISVKGASNSSWCYQCLHRVVAFYCSEVVAVQTCNTLNGRLMWGHHAAIGLLNILYWCHYGRVDRGSVLKLTSILFV